MSKYFWVDKVDASLRLTAAGADKFLNERESLTDIQLLELSVEKWEVIAKYQRLHRKKGIFFDDGGYLTCACCNKYFKKYDCGGCPIKLYTGFACCDSTPYSDYHHEHNYENAIAEVEFLQAILDHLQENIDGS